MIKKHAKNYIQPKHKKETEKTALANKMIETLVLYAFYDYQPRNRAGPILTAPKAHMGW